MNLAEKLKYLRKRNNLSQEQLGDELGISRQSISKWESEQSIPEIDKIVKLSEIYGVTTDYILKDMEDGLQNSTLAIEDKRQTSFNKKIRLIFATLCISFSIVSLFVVWALSKAYPAPITFYNEKTKLWLVGFDNFLMTHGLEAFYNLCWLIIIIGLVLLFLDKLKVVFKDTVLDYK